MRLAADVSTIGGGRDALLGAAASSVFDSATWASLSIWAVRRGAKKFFVVNFTAGGTVVTLLGVQAASPWSFAFVF
jgi:hypothetical protein